MGTKTVCFCVLLFFAAFGRGEAAQFRAEIADQNGRPAANAVVMLIPDDRAGMPAASSRLESKKLIGQREETFVPIVTIVPRGGTIAFTNDDPTMHQVYSFSATKRFELTLAHGQTSNAVTFDKSGVAAIGCNIHDDMIAYAFVTDSPWTALTDENGRLRIADLPLGAYTAQIWHPRLPPATAAPKMQVSFARDTVLRTQISLLPDKKGHRRHGGGY